MDPASASIWKTVRTEILLETINRQLLTDTGRHYSILWRITTAVDDFGNKIWANIIPETGGGPGRSGKHSGKNNPMYGKKRDDLTGPNSPNKQQHRRDQNSTSTTSLWKNKTHKNKMSDLRKEKWTEQEYIDKMKLRIKTNKRVIINGIEYESLRAAAIVLGLDPSTVSKRCSSQCEKFSNWNYI